MPAVGEEDVGEARGRDDRLRNCLGMIWSVSMFGSASGTAVEVRVKMAIMVCLRVLFGDEDVVRVALVLDVAA